MGDATEDTSPASLSGMRKAVEKNNEVSKAALEWAVKTYNMVQPVAAGMAAAQAQARVSARDSRWALVAACIAILASGFGIACELVR